MTIESQRKPQDKVKVQSVNYILNSNSSSPMESKMHRYMQRIQKIIATPTRTISPLRPSKSPIKAKTTQLDKYLKYELSAKIINNIINKHNDQLITLFFNLIRRSQYRQKQRIYKFVAIQKKEVKVDLGIAAKIMVSVIKQLMKKRYYDFTRNIPQNKQTQQLPCFTKKAGQGEMKSAVLVRTSSRPQTSHYKQVSQWIYEAESSKGTEINPKKIEKFKNYASKTLVRLMYFKVKKCLQAGFAKIQQCSIIANQKKLNYIAKSLKDSKSKVAQNWQIKEQTYKAQIERLNDELTKQRAQPLISDFNSFGKDNESKEDIEKSPNQIDGLIHHKFIKHKSKTLADLRMILTLSFQTKINLNKENKKASVSQGALCLLHVYLKTLSYALLRLKEEQIRKNINSGKKEQAVIRLCILLNNKQLQNNCTFFNRFSLQPVIVQKPQSPKVEDIPLPTPLLQPKKSNQMTEKSSSLKKYSFNDQGTPLTLKLNFYTFVDKMFKLILIVSKMLIPLKESFNKIDLYASYSYRIEESFKAVYQNKLREAFSALQCHNDTYIQHAQGEQKIVEVLSKLIRQKYISSFSHIKVISKEKNLKIKIFPVRQSIVEGTHLFLEERKIYSMYSLQYWGKLKIKKLIENSPGNPENDYSKKRSNTAF